MQEIGAMNVLFDTFKSFLLGELNRAVGGNTFLDGKPLTYYREKIEDLFEDATPQTILDLRKKGMGLNVNIQHLMEFGNEALMDLRNELEKNPKKTMGRMNKKFKDAVIELSGNVGITEFYIHPYNIDSPDPSAGGRSHKIKIRSLGKQHSEHIVTVEGMISKASKVEPLLREGAFECLSCHNEFTVVQPKLGQYIAPNAIYKRCPNSQCRSKNLSSVQIIENRCRVTPWQSLTIQEPPEELPSGSTPTAIDLICLGDYVDKVTPGVKIEATGILYLRPKFNPAKSSHTPAKFDFFVHVLHIKEDLEDERDIEITDADIARIQSIGDADNTEDLIINSIAPSMYKYHKVKYGLALQQFGGVEHIVRKEGRKERGEIHILMAGDPGTNKSSLMLYTKELMPKRWAYVLGSKTTLAGLVAGIVKDKKNGVMTLEAGASVLASGGILCLDEFGDLRPDAKNAMLEVMVNRSVSINKAGIHAQLPAECSVLGAMNPVFRRYKRGKTFGENMKLDDAIASRFDLIFLILDEPDKEFDSHYISHMRSMYEDDEAITEVEGTTILSKDILIKYIQFAKERYNPKMTDEAWNSLKKYYIELRSSQYGIDNASGRFADRRTPHTIRRLAEANARLNLRDKVISHDIDVAFDLYQYTLSEIAKDPFGGYDIDAVSGYTTKKHNVTEKIKNVLMELMEDADTTEEYSRETGVPFSIILNQAIESKVLIQKEGVDTASQLESILNNLLKLGEIIQPLDGSSSEEPTYRVMGRVVKKTRTITRKNNRS